MPSPTEAADPALLAAVVQDLESLRRAGLRHVPHIDESHFAPSPPPGPSQAGARASVGRAMPVRDPSAQPAPAFAMPTPGARSAPTSAPARLPPSREPSQESPVPRASSASTRNAARSTPPDAAPLNPPSGCGLNRAQRDEHLAAARLKVAACVRCGELAAARTQTVFGVGDTMTKIVFIGEAPGADEDKQGEPFVGKAGQLLNKIIEASRLRREEIYIANVLKCRPPGNRTPSPQEADNCWEYLSAQLTILDPDYIVCWGSVAAQTLLKTTTAIGKLRGKFHAYGRAKVLCTYHPSYLLRNPAAKKDVWEDMKIWRREMGVEL